MIREDGPDHQKRFYASVVVAGEVLGHGEGRSKKLAEQAAATEACAALVAQPGVAGAAPAGLTAEGPVDLDPASA